MARAPRVLILVQNLPLQVDRRVREEASALVASGYRVSVICPRGPDEASRSTVAGAAVYSYRPPPPARGAAGYLWEFVYCWLRTALLSVLVWRERGFDIIQACNPPDTFWLLGRIWRIWGVRFVFDHHDLNPELFRSRFGEPTSLVSKIQFRSLCWLERCTWAAADRVIATNESYRDLAMSRGGVSPQRITVVRSAPDPETMRPVRADRPHPADRHLIAYLGIMGPQDDVHLVLELMAELRRRDRRDVHAVLMGFGDCLAELKQLCSALELDDVVTFSGRVGPEEIGRNLSAASVGIGPDRKTPLNDVSTMNKTMEYMAYAVVPVTFDLRETERSLGGTGVVVPSGDIGLCADAVERVLDDPEHRVALSVAARARIEQYLDWRHQAADYVAVFDRLLHRRPHPLAPRPLATADPLGRRYVAADELESFVRARGPLVTS